VEIELDHVSVVAWCSVQISRVLFLISYLLRSSL
jgi:hypothetical protein